MIKVVFCYWGSLVEEEMILLQKIMKEFRKIYDNEEMEVSSLNIKAFELLRCDYSLLFDSHSYIDQEDFDWRTFSLTELKNNNLAKKELLKLLKIISSFIKEKESKRIVVKKENTTLGIGGDIKLTEEELKYLMDLKSLLNGGKIIIKKNDIEIKIEDKE